MASNLIVKLISISFIITLGTVVDSLEDAPATTSSHIWLTVSSQASRKNIFSTEYIQRELIFNWESLPIKPDTWIGLFDHQLNESMVTSTDAIYTLELDSPDGSHQTNIEFPVFEFENTIPVSGCLKYYMVWAEGDQIVQINCIKVQADWMKSIIDSIRYKSIKSLVIPGTHNSGSYSIGYQSGLISVLIDSYTLCQDESVYNQLVYGNRYLDVRVRYEENNDEHFWVGHGDFPIQRTIREVLEQIKSFLDSTESEIVILDFHRFPIGFEQDGIVNATRHLELLDLVQSIVGNHLADNSDATGYDKTVNTFLTKGQRLILGHAESQTLRKSFLFPNVEQVWAETDSIDALLSYFNENLCLSHSKAYAAMAQLTPELVKYLFYGGLRKMAQSVNPLLTNWFQVNQVLNKCANIIATDFFLGNNIIEIAIASNSN